MEFLVLRFGTRGSQVSIFSPHPRLCLLVGRSGRASHSQHSTQSLAGKPEGVVRLPEMRQVAALAEVMHVRAQVAEQLGDLGDVQRRGRTPRRTSGHTLGT